MKDKDKEVGKLIKEEERRQKDTINLIASENFVSQNGREAIGSVFCNKYSEGYPGKRYYAGNEVVDTLEQLTQNRALKLYKLSPKKWGVNVQALSGAAANFWAYFALVPLGEKIMGQELSHGGHLTHGAPVSHTSKIWTWVHYPVDSSTHRFEYDAIMELAKKEKPRLIVAGASAYSRIIDFKKFRKIADTVGAYLMVDMAHIAGLIAGGIHPSPFPYADIVTTTTHKTLRGTRGALIFFKKEFEKEINKSVFPAGQGGPHDHQTAAIAVALNEAMRPSFKIYVRQIVQNAKALAGFLKAKGYAIITGGTDNHLFLIDVTKKGMSGNDAQNLLEHAGITVNKNGIPYDTRKPMDPSGIRIGTPAVTTRGMREKEMRAISEMIDDILMERIRPEIMKARVKKFVKKFPTP